MVKIIEGSDLTQTLLEACATLLEALGPIEFKISAKLLQAGGYMDLLLGEIGADTIHLIGRWSSNEMLRYLHVMENPLIKGYFEIIMATVG